MHYYSHHIGDFRSGTVNMTRQERWIYRDLLDVYYDSEKPLSLDLDYLCHNIGVRSDEERKIVSDLLRFKFEKTDLGYRNERCDGEIAEYHKKAGVARENGKSGGRPKKPKITQPVSDGLQVGSESDADSHQTETGSQTNQEPITNNQEPEKPEQGARAATAVDLSIALRKAKINCQPADPRLIALAEQGITVETAEAACAEARNAKPEETIGLGYVVKILERWAADSKKVKVAGAGAPQRSAPWWSSDPLILAEGQKHGMRPHAGESMQTFKGRIQAAIDDVGTPPARPTPPIRAVPDLPRSVRPDGLAPLASLVKKLEQA